MLKITLVLYSSKECPEVAVAMENQVYNLYM